MVRVNALDIKLDMKQKQLLLPCQVFDATLCK